MRIRIIGVSKQTSTIGRPTTSINAHAVFRPANFPPPPQRPSIQRHLANTDAGPFKSLARVASNNRGYVFEPAHGAEDFVGTTALAPAGDHRMTNRFSTVANRIANTFPPRNFPNISRRPIPKNPCRRDQNFNVVPRQLKLREECRNAIAPSEVLRPAPPERKIAAACPRPSVLANFD